MVDFTVPEEIQMICRGLRSFLEKEVRPLEEKHKRFLEDERARLQDDGSLVSEFKEILSHVRRRSAELGYYAMHMPQDVGKINRSIIDDGSQAELIFENCKVPRENVIGQEGMGFYIAMSWLGIGRLNMASWSIGLAHYLLKRCVEYANLRTAFGKPIGKYQHIRDMIATSAAELYAAEQMVLHASWKMDQGESIIAESAMAKWYATNMLYRLADRAVQIHGGMGVMKELPIERIFRFARILRIVEGTDEIQKETIAKSLEL